MINESIALSDPSSCLSIIIVNSPYLSDRHLDFVIHALNQQSDPGFNTFWVEQSPDANPLRQRLNEKACFRWLLLHPGQDYLDIGRCDLLGVGKRISGNTSA